MLVLLDTMARYRLLWIALLGLTSFLYLAVSVNKFRYTKKLLITRIVYVQFFPAVFSSFRGIFSS
jgi:hypothetical protein